MTTQAIASVLKNIIGKPCWNVKQGYGSFITFEFGEPSLEIDEPIKRKGILSRLIVVRGEWHLWIYCCDWKIFQNGQYIADSESEDRLIEQALNYLDGQKPVSIEIEPTNDSCSFQFDLGGLLETTSGDYEPLTNEWLLFDPSGFVLCYRNYGCYSYHPSNSSDESAIWKKIDNKITVPDGII
ncbi:MAG TPA: hypothetical protein DDW76_11390 [Cyanobacteria bacterium UBA11369]|nr:hypothetical protein [Cyanobacteria bacterium UBA11371]HBE34733.1 hypothetical protein [Cyanobacteria bacterium UBA11368]HBE49374.1 hypothetical protein [Cyanobacteria bacterium UBA11369]